MTMTQLLNLKDNELDVLAAFMGHDIRTHRQYYRLPQETIQVANVSQVLIALERGTISSIKGKSLDEVCQQLPSDDLEGKVPPTDFTHTA
jgi:hypothetical protein